MTMRYFSDSVLDPRDFSAVEEMWVETNYRPSDEHDLEPGVRKHGWSAPYRIDVEALALVRPSHETFGQAAAGIDGGAKPGRVQAEWYAELPEDAEPVLRLAIKIGNNSDGIARVDFHPVIRWHAPLSVALRDRRLTLLFDRHDGINHVKDSARALGLADRGPGARRRSSQRAVGDGSAGATVLRRSDTRGRYLGADPAEHEQRKLLISSYASDRTRTGDLRRDRPAF